jgi:hypothetical protein
MILRGTPPRALSGAGFVAVVALGALLLPLLPTRADDTPGEEAAEKPAAKKAVKPATSDRLPAPKKVPEKPADPFVTSPKTGTRPAPGGKTRSSRATAADKQTRAEQLEEARDEVELLEAQLEGKHAEVKEALARLKQAEVELKRLKEVRAKAKEAATAQDIEAAQSRVEVRQAQVQGKKAQFREAALRLQQAKRRLARLEKRQAKDTSDSRRPPEKPTIDRKKFRELEKKLDALRKDVESLRREMPPEEVRRSGRPAEKIILNQRAFAIPICTDPTARRGLKEIILFKSADRGRTWKQAAVIPPGCRRVQVCCAQGRRILVRAWFCRC